MNFAFRTFLLLIMTSPLLAQQNFKQQQQTFERVKTAYAGKWGDLQNELKKQGLQDGFKLYIVAYKSEGKLELWLKGKQKTNYSLFKTYDFSAHSGTLGPKVKEGDGQTPEGFYIINAFNPVSNFYLSLGVSYPNQLDIQRSGKNKPGGDIYIHGNQVTIGCIPLTDDKIKEVYIMAVEARNGGQKEIPVHIFPFKMTKGNIDQQVARFPQQKIFWANLKPGYDYFERYKKPPVMKIISGGYKLDQ